MSRLINLPLCLVWETIRIVKVLTNLVNVVMPMLISQSQKLDEYKSIKIRPRLTKDLCPIYVKDPRTDLQDRQSQEYAPKFTADPSSAYIFETCESAQFISQKSATCVLSKAKSVGSQPYSFPSWPGVSRSQLLKEHGMQNERDARGSHLPCGNVIINS